MNHAALRATIVTLLALLLALPLGAQNLKPFESSGKYGFVDDLGDIVIPAQYDNVGYFKDGIAPVALNEKYGFIDITGKTVIPIQFDEILSESSWGINDYEYYRGINVHTYFYEGLACVKQNGKYGFIDKTGKTVIPIQFDDTAGFVDGLAIVRQNDKCGIIDTTGKFIVPVKFEDINSFSEGVASVKQNDKYGFIDKTGKIVIPIQYEWAGDFNEGLSVVQQNGKYGLINKRGQFITPAQFEDFHYFMDGLAMVKLNGKYGFIDKTGKLVIPAMFDEVDLLNQEGGDYVEGEPEDPSADDESYFVEGLVAVRINDKWGAIDKTGKLVIPAKYDYIDQFSEGVTSVEQNDKWGMIDKTGKLIIPIMFDERFEFSEGLAAVSQNGKSGFIDKTGNMVIASRFDYSWGFSEGLAPVCINDKYGYIDKTGKFIIPAQFEAFDSFNQGLAKVKLNGKYGFIDKTGKMVIAAKFEDAFSFDEDLACVCINDKWGCIDKTGNFVIRPRFDSPFLFFDGIASVQQNGNIYGSVFFIDKQGRRYTTRKEGKEFLARERDREQMVVHDETKKTTAQSAPDAGYADRVVDVDSDIPQAKGANFGTYAVVIANENYRSVADVGNAANDGNVLHQYLTKTLGIPENNVIYCENASAAMMDEALTTLETKTRSAAALGKAFNVIFYYSGHGVPTEGTSDAYLLPVDVSPKNLKRYGFSLDELYRRLGALEAQCVTVLLDACFSGAGRTGAMLADVKGVALEPKKAAPTGNMVVLSACSGSQTAHIFKEGKHGLFTYWLLRKLKETKGEVTLGELQEHLAQYVDYTATNRLNLPGQQPTLQVSPTLSRNWRAIPLR